MARARLFGMAVRGNYSGLVAFGGSARSAGLIEKRAFDDLMIAERKRDLAAAQHICSRRGLYPFTLSLCMTILADLGDLDRSFAIAGRLYPYWHAAPGSDPDRFWLEHPDGLSTAVIVGPAARSMRTDARYVDLVRKLGLLEYWRARHPPDFCTKAHEPVCAAIRRRAS